jgi:hypothetical protein
MTAALLSLSGCFTGTFLAGQPCADDLDCGPNLRCEEGRCAGATAGDPTSSTSADPTTSTTAAESTTTAAESTTTAEPTTSTSSDPTTSTTAESTTSTTDPSTTGPSCGVGGCEMIDVLIVLDNSPSMSSKFDTMLSLVVGFGEVLFPLLKQFCSVHLGTITSNVFKNNVAPCDQIGAMVRAEGGGPCPFAEGKPYATSADLNNLPAFNCILTTGAQGDPNERIYDSIYKSFGDLDLLCNGGFHRPGAFLVVLIATDEDDGEGDDPQGHKGSDELPHAIWANTLALLKDTNLDSLDNLYIAAVLGDEDQDSSACPWSPLEGSDGQGASPAPFLRAFLEKFPAENRVIGSLCNPDPDPSDFTPMFDEAVKEIKSLCGA